MNRHAVRWELRACHPSMQLKMGRLPGEEIVVPELADGFAVAGLDAAADGDDAWPAFDLPAFERAIVDGHLLRLLRNLAAVIGVVDDEVGIGAERDRAFAREEAEDLCG